MWNLDPFLAAGRPSPARTHERIYPQEFFCFGSADYYKTAKTPFTSVESLIDPSAPQTGLPRVSSATANDAKDIIEHHRGTTSADKSPSRSEQIKVSGWTGVKAGSWSNLEEISAHLLLSLSSSPLYGSQLLAAFRLNRLTAYRLR
ncbi:hypothetical protein E4U31_000750 [Claviceps sp. LM219 group G6]|nr:hypothetical protein E4U31_000750 [Claviceps sp. LM219 group G6]